MVFYFLVPLFIVYGPGELVKLLIIVIAMLATCAGAVHSWYTKNQYVQAAMMSEAFNLADSVKQRVSDHFIELGRLPGNNRQLGLPDSGNLVGTTVRGVAVRQGGLINVEFDGEMGPQTMSFVPAVNPSSGYLYWQCVSDTISPGVLSKLRPGCAHHPDTKESHLQQAAVTGDSAQLIFWLGEGADPNEFVNGLTPLMLAVVAGDSDISKKLLDAGANPNLNARNHDGYTPVILALKSRNHDLVRLLLDSQTLALQGDHHGQSAREYAQIADNQTNSNVFFNLINASLNPQFTSHPAESFKRQKPEADTAPIAQKSTEVERTSPLESAINSKDLRTARLLINENANVNQLMSNESRPLIEASKRGFVDIVSLLITHGASLEATDMLGRTAYLAAVGAGHSGVAEMLIDAGANSRVADKNGVDAQQMHRSRAGNVARLLQVAMTED